MKTFTCRRRRNWAGLLFITAIIFFVSQAAVLAADAVPQATLDAPASAQIGASFSFSVSFDNASTNITGYGPYIDVAFDQTGQDGAWYPPAAFPPPGAATNEFDGLTLAASVTYLGSALPSADIHLLYFDDTANSGLGVEHPYAIDTNGLPVYVLTSDFSPTNRFQNGDGFLVVRLPFGSFTPEQPVAELFFSGDVSELADVDDSLPISVRGGYMFGNDPLDNPTADPAILGAQDDSDPAVQPTLIEMTKTYIGPENETATGPNFKRRYVLSVDIAEGQVITNLNIIDNLPDTMQFTRVTDTNRAAGTGVISAILTPSTNTPGGTLQYSFGTVTGTVSAADATLEFEYFVPRLDASSNAVLNATTGDDRLLPNQAHAYGDWIPIDGRDAAARVAALATVAGMVVTPSPAPEHQLEAQSIAIQKGVSVVGGGSALPEEVLEYTIQFQVSDYFAFTNVVITDVISDGQRFATNFTPTLSFTEHGNTLSGNMNAANFTVTPNYSEPPAATHLENSPTNGTTTIDFRVSSELVTRGTNDNLVGGGIDSDITGLSGSPYNNPPLPHEGTIGTLVFRTVVQDRYSDNFLSGNPSLNPRDGLSNTIDIDGDLLDPDDLSSLGTSEGDDSGDSLGLPAPTLSKSIFAINGSTNLPSPLSLRPGETVTFRLQTTLFTGDIEEFTLSDFVPLPILKVNDPTDIGTNTWSWVRDASTNVAPPSGEWKYGSTDTFSLGVDLSPPFSDPAVTFNAASGNNTLIFDFGTYDDTNNATRKVDMLFTMTVNSEPFADNLLLMNQAQASDRNTTTTVADNEVITPFTLNQPMVNIFKGVLGSTQGGALTLGGVVYGAPSTAATLAAAETLETQVEVDALGASDLTTDPLPDANDRVRYGVVLFNSGRADAYDVKVTETLPTAYERDFADTNAFVSGVNFIVQRGTGAVLTNGSDYVLGWDNTSKAFSLELVDNHAGGPGLGSPRASSHRNT